MSCQSLMIRASAGSGKTYQLANRFLALLVMQAEPSSIIALTFTRKAAGEFADRILAKLAEGASSDANAAVLSSELLKVIHGDPEQNQPALVVSGDPVPPLDRELFQQLLEKVVKSLDRLALGTIDAFFTRIARTSWAELGLDGFGLLQDAELEAERERTLARIFSRLGAQEEAPQAFIQAFKKATFGVDENRVLDKLNEFIERYHGRLLECRDGEAWGQESRLWPEGNPWPEFHSDNFKQKAKKLAELSDDVQWAEKRFGAAWENLLTFIQKFEPGRKLGEIPLEAKLIGSLKELELGALEFKYYQKVISLNGELAILTADLLGTILQTEVQSRLIQTQGIFKVMDLYERLYESEIRQRGRLGFSDLTMVLASAGIGRNGVGQNIGYRLDQWFEHWMLDEFQDTSRLQWQVLSGLIQEVQQDDEGRRSFFVVGDPKQGIHAWRGGEPRLFGEIAADWQGRLPEWRMNRSFRSSPAVLDLVNVVCDPELMARRFPAAATDRWDFDVHRAAKPLPGESVVLEVLPADPDDADAPDDAAVDDASGSGDGAGGFGVDGSGDGNDDGVAEVRASKPTWPAIVGLLKKYEPLSRGLSCAILVQKNKVARAIGDYVRSKIPNLPVEVESETPMEDDGPMAAALLDYFRWLHTPADRMAWGHVAHCPLMGALEDAFGTREESELWQAARAEFAANGLAGLVCRVAGALRKTFPLDAFNLGRLEAWELAAREFDVRGGDLKDWLRILKAWKTREYSGAGAIQIMTVHKSKGLEFDMVILPDLDGPAFDSLGNLKLLTERDAAGRTPFLMLSPPKWVYAGDERLGKLCEHWKAETTYERFCGFYVAMTRAVHGLYLLVPERKTKKSGTDTNNQAQWLRAALENQQAPTRVFDLPGVNQQLLWSSGGDEWLEGASGPVTDLSSVKAAEAIKLLPPDPSVRLRASTPSGAKSGAAQKAANLSRDRREAMAFGSSVHAAFEAIGWLDGGGELPRHPDEAVQKLVGHCLSVPEVRSFFQHPGGEVQLWREQAFDVIEDGKWISGVMDRVIVHRQNGRAVGATVIDYKTDAVSEASELLDKYSAQLEVYRSSLALILEIEPAEIRCVLISTHKAEVVDVPGA